MPAQITIRAEEALVDRLKVAARQSGRSMNEFVVRILEAATDPDLAGDDATRIRERLAAADLLVSSSAPVEGPAPGRLAEARARAGKGTPLSDLISSER
ncbi:MAG: transcriptional regulator [Acidimicrobiales bacterium]|nr:transcriptional regulator [Acidimicrobiales bacterium]